MRLLFVNLRKNTKFAALAAAEAERYGHTVFNLLEHSKPETSILSNLYTTENDKDEFRANIARIFRDQNIDLVVTQTENLYPLLDAMSLPMLPKMSIPVDTLTDKEKFAIFCADNNIPSPDTLVPTTIKDLRNTFDRAIFVKPSNGTAGTRSLFLSEDKYSMFDYIRYESPQHFIDVLRKYGAQKEFEHTQTYGKELPFGKGLGGIKGRHLIQECVSSKVSYIINALFAYGKLWFSIIYRSFNTTFSDMYYYSDKNNEFVCCEKDFDRNQSTARKFLGAKTYNSFVDTMQQIRQRAGIELCAFNIHLIPVGNAFYVQDFHPRLAGTLVNMVKITDSQKTNKYYDAIRLQDYDYPSIWEHI